jgi:hypothetical protein
VEQFDVFLAHNSLDKPEVKVIAAALRQRNLKPWIDDEQIQPGRPFQDEIQQAIPLVKSAAIFISLHGLGRWQSWELKALIDQCVERNIPVIPVLLPGVQEIPEKFIFLKQFRWVSFSQSIEDELALSYLEWGITGRKPETFKLEKLRRAIIELIPNFKKLIRDIRGQSAETKPPQVIPIPDITPKIQSQPTTNPKQTQEPEKISPSTQDNGNQSQDKRQFLKWVVWGSVSLVTSVLGRVIWLTQNPSLESEKGMDYTKLRRLLANKNWKEADDETYRVMIQAVSKKEGDLFTSGEILNFPCTDLRTIDRLWVKYSNGHFGFSVQKEIYLSVGGKADGEYYEEAWRKFGDRVGWRGNSTGIYNCAQVIYNISAPKGHLPICLDKRRGDTCQSGGNGRGIVSIFYNLRREDVILFYRIETCKL